MKSALFILTILLVLTVTVLSVPVPVSTAQAIVTGGILGGLAGFGAFMSGVCLIMVQGAMNLYVVRHGVDYALAKAQQARAGVKMEADGNMTGDEALMGEQRIEGVQIARNVTEESSSDDKAT